MVDLEVSVESDFADLFDVKDHQALLRGTLQGSWDETSGRLATDYRHKSFSRGLIVEAGRPDSPMQYANGFLRPSDPSPDVHLA